MLQLTAKYATMTEEFR